MSAEQFPLIEHTDLFGALKYAKQGEYCVLSLFGYPIYRRVADMELVRLFWFNLYQRRGNIKSILFISWVKNDESSS